MSFGVFFFIFSSMFLTCCSMMAISSLESVLPFCLYNAINFCKRSFSACNRICVFLFSDIASASISAKSSLYCRSIAFSDSRSVVLRCCSAFLSAFSCSCCCFLAPFSTSSASLTCLACSNAIIVLSMFCLSSTDNFFSLLNCKRKSSIFLSYC